MLFSNEPEPFSLPSPLPVWPEGKGFAKGIISLGELEVVCITKFQTIWICHEPKYKNRGAIFYKPTGIPHGFFSLGDSGQRIGQHLRGFVLAARPAVDSDGAKLPPLQKPTDYMLKWCSSNKPDDECAFFWFPCPPKGYIAAGYVVTKGSGKPSVEDVRCVRTDLADICEIQNFILCIKSSGSDLLPFIVWKHRPCFRGMWCRGVPTGTFCCSTSGESSDESSIYCLKNLDLSLTAMPDLNQIHALIKHYGPTVFFHPEEIYLPSSVPWFFTNGATMHTRGDASELPIDANGLNLPVGGANDGEYWIDLPGGNCNPVRHGNIDSAELYVHVKPALGGTSTDIVMWVFCPFNGPVTLKIGMINTSLKTIGQHVGDWEHFTLRINNFSGELSSVYFSQHSRGEWVDALDLEFVEGNKAAIYSSKSGHASYPHAGTYLQGSVKFGIGVRNEAARSHFYVDSSFRYKIVAAEYLRDALMEPCWLQYMRQWGPKVVYGSRPKIDRILRFFPENLRCLVENVLEKLPTELFGEEGPTGPKEKDYWVGDERS